MHLVYKNDCLAIDESALCYVGRFFFFINIGGKLIYVKLISYCIILQISQVPFFTQMYDFYFTFFCFNHELKHLQLFYSNAIHI